MDAYNPCLCHECRDMALVEATVEGLLSDQADARLKQVVDCPIEDTHGCHGRRRHAVRIGNAKTLREPTLERVTRH